MNKQDIEFLVDLQHELLTQEHDETRDPRWWGVMEDREYRCERDDGNTVYLYRVDDPDFEVKDPTPEDVMQVGIEYEGMSEEDFEEDLWNAETALERLNEDASQEYELVETRTVWELNHGCLFLTKKECKEYIKRYGYNHNNPRSYAMCADRCETYTRLLEILKNTNWEELAND